MRLRRNLKKGMIQMQNREIKHEWWTKGNSKINFKLIGILSEERTLRCQWSFSKKHSMTLFIYRCQQWQPLCRWWVVALVFVSKVINNIKTNVLTKTHNNLNIYEYLSGFVILTSLLDQKTASQTQGMDCKAALGDSVTASLDLGTFSVPLSPPGNQETSACGPC